jgi:hypothetical protein
MILLKNSFILQAVQVFRFGYPLCLIIFPYLHSPSSRFGGILGTESAKMKADFALISNLDFYASRV